MRQWALTRKGQYVRNGVRNSKEECLEVAAHDHWPENTPKLNRAVIEELESVGYSILRVKVKSVGPKGFNDED